MIASMQRFLSNWLHTVWWFPFGFSKPSRLAVNNRVEAVVTGDYKAQCAL
jgi:hypothetical protein